MTKQNLFNRDISSIGMLRGIAALMVCFFHFTWGMGTDYLPVSNVLVKAGKWGWTGVEIFFVISGFIIPYSMLVNDYSITKVFTFLKKRIVRIEPPYLISVALVIVLNYVSTLSPYYRGAPFKPDWINTLGHIAYLNAFTGRPWLNPAFWTLALEFQYYLLIALLFGFVVSPKRYLRLIFFVVFTVPSLIAPPNDGYIFFFTGYFLAGIVLFQYYSRIINRTEFLILILITLGLLYYKQGPFIFALITGTILAILYIKKVPSFMQWLGTISYSLYLIHVPIGGRVLNLAETLLHKEVLRGIMVFVALGITLVCAALYYRFIEKPFKSRAARIKYDQPAPADPGTLSPVVK
jgi:peptidoglycan/LPS O-acetylase OafA/YrhL